jgi:diguanylate cyclase (GGDEF)-like protein/PAS domain S-box-containing protein
MTETETQLKRYQALMKNALDGIHVMDVQGNVVEVNDSFCYMLGYTHEEACQLNIADWNAQWTKKELLARLKNLAGKSARFETIHRRKDGTQINVEISTTGVEIEGQTYFFASSRDITERKKTEQKIQFLTEIYAALSQTNQTLIESKDETTLFNRICQIVVGFGGMELAWIGINEEKTGWIKPVSAYGSQTDYLDNIVISSREDVPEGNGPTGTAFREMRSIFVQNHKTDPMLANWRKQISRYGWGSSGTVSITRGGKSYAVLSFYHSDEQVFTEATIRLLNEMARNIGYGLDRFDLEQEKLKSQKSMQLAAKIYQTSVEAIMVTDENNLIVDINPAFTSITGYPPEEVIGKSPKLLQSGKHNKEFYREMWQSILNTGHWQGELWDRRKDGELHAKFTNISLMRHPDGSIYRHVAQFSDITEKKQKEELIWKQANFDTLTNLPNRHMFRDRLEQEILRSQQTGLPVALLLIDMDRFKEINDTLGHAKGDKLLVEAAHRIKMCARITDMVSRLGGDEFTVILPVFGERLHLERIVQDIINELANPFDLGDEQKGYISASIGITIYPNDAEDIESLLKHADQAMYAAKAEGRNCFSYFTQSMQLEAQEKLALTNDLRHALARHELHVYYQPILELQSGNITKAEALLRWRHPTRGMVSPAVFIPLAEEAGLIHEIGDWVFQEAVARVADWQKRFGRIIQISVNKSPVQFEQPEKQIWQKRMNELGLPGNGIAVEITEGLLFKESSKAKERLLEFRNSGIEVSIDDFGTGFSSLSYLKQFDIDYLKIDQSFVKDLEINPDDKALTEAIIVMAHKLGIRTIAEGVETEGQRDFLKSFGCDYVQGFLYSPAVPAAEFEKLIAEPNSLPK